MEMDMRTEWSSWLQCVIIFVQYLQWYIVIVIDIVNHITKGHLRYLVVLHELFDYVKIICK